MEVPEGEAELCLSFFIHKEEQEDTEPPSSHRHRKTAMTYRAAVDENDLKTFHD